MGELVYDGVVLVLRPFVAQLFDIDVVGLEHLPAAGPAIIASNHLSHADPLVTGLVGARQHPKLHFRWLAKRELFAKPPLSWVLRGAHQIPVDRGTSAAADSLHSAKAALAAGELIWIYPEGTISPLFVPMRAHSGVARLALDAGVPVVPVGMWGAHRTMTKYRRRELRRHRPVTIDIGAPLRFGPAAGEPERDATEVADAIMAAISALVERTRARYPEQPATGDWWGPPAEDWLPDRAGRWRPKLDKGMSSEEALAECHRALHEVPA